jgi:hypothetical protein
MKSKRLLLALAFGLGLAPALLTALSRSPEVARAWPPGRTAGPAFVKAGEPMSGTSGYCAQSDPCGSIQYAINESEPGNGDTIYVAGGAYTSTGTAVITVTKSVAVYGGWDGVSTGPLVRNPISYPAILDAENGRRVAYITGTVAPLLEGLTLQRGNAAGLGGDPVIVGGDFGGAVYANNASPVITNCRIVSSTAGFGGGLALYYGAPTVGNSVVLTNTASQTVSAVLRGVGGGLFLYYSSATITANVVMSNVASGWFGYDGGGGLYIDGSPALIRGNIIQGNEGRLNGGGLYLYQSGATVRDNVIRGNSAPAGDGGGLYLVQSAATVRGNTIETNTASLGGGLYSLQSGATVRDNTILNNAASSGGGLHLLQSGATVRGNRIMSNTAPLGGGIYIESSAATVRENEILRNDAWRGGGVCAALSPTGLEANTILDNQASQFGGGLCIGGCAPFTLTNNIVGRNATQGGGPALYVGTHTTPPPGSVTYPSQGVLLHNTFADNNSPLGPWMIETSVSSTLALTNTIIGKPGGITVTASGLVTLYTTLWDPALLLQPGLVVTGGGIVVSSTNYFSEPGVLSPTYRLGPGSAAIDRGANAGVTTDIDGDPRPNGPLPDIGADEFYCDCLTDVTISGPTRGVTSTAYTFTATVSPPTATLPTSYTWQASEQPLTSHAVFNRPTDTLVFSWTIAGAKIVTVTAANCGGSVEDTHPIRISLREAYLPLVLRNSP